MVTGNHYDIDPFLRIAFPPEGGVTFFRTRRIVFCPKQSNLYGYGFKRVSRISSRRSLMVGFTRPA